MEPTLPGDGKRMSEPMELLERFVQGDDDAFEALFRQFQREVYGWIVRIVRDPAEAEELTVETFWRVYRAHARFDPRRSFGAWLRVVASHVAIDALKKRRRETPLLHTLAAPAGGDPLAARETRERVTQVFRQLPPALQAVAVLALVEERPHLEIAEALGISRGAVKSRVFRACRILQSKLRRMGVEP